MWLEGSAGPPPAINPGADSIVKNYGLNTLPADPAPEDLSLLTPDNSSLSQYGIPYWYQIEYIQDAPVAGSGRSWREFSYIARSNANQTQEVEVGLSKIYRIGY